MLRTFFSEKFKKDHQINKVWFHFLMDQDDVINDKLKKEFSHLINVHHIWITRICGKQPESHSWDILPMIYWEQLLDDNHRKTQEMLNYFTNNEVVPYQSEEGLFLSSSTSDVLYHILQHSTHHRAKMIVELNLLGIVPPNTELIILED